MNTLENKRYEKYDYTCRYTTVPYFYDTLESRDIYGIGSNLYKNIQWFGHKLVKTDTLENLSLKYYNNPTYWWIIAYFNDIQDPFIKLTDRYDIIKIPNITNIEFGNER